MNRYQRYRWYRHLNFEPDTDVDYWENHYPAYLRWVGHSQAKVPSLKQAQKYSKSAPFPPLKPLKHPAPENFLDKFLTHLKDKKKYEEWDVRKDCESGCPSVSHCEWGVCTCNSNSFQTWGRCHIKRLQSERGRYHQVKLRRTMWVPISGWWVCGVPVHLSWWRQRGRCMWCRQWLLEQRHQYALPVALILVF